MMTIVRGAFLPQAHIQIPHASESTVDAAVEADAIIAEVIAWCNPRSIVKR